MVVVDKFTPGIASAFSAAPSSFAVANGGLWGSGGPALDEAGNVYDTTGNSLDGSNDSSGVWGESLLVWSPGIPLRLRGTYTPWNYCEMDHADADLGGSSPVVIPDLGSTSTSTPNLISSRVGRRVDLRDHVLVLQVDPNLAADRAWEINNSDLLQYGFHARRRLLRWRSSETTVERGRDAGHHGDVADCR